MKLSLNLRSANRARLGVASIASIAAVGLLVALPGSAQAATAVLLGTADSFAVLGDSAITNTGPTTINGDFGTFPTTSISGTGSIVVTGTNHAGDAVTQTAVIDAENAYGVAAGQVQTGAIVDDLTGETFGPGVYNTASSILLTGEMTLDAAGDPNAVFVFQSGETLTTMSNSLVTLTNGAQACNVFWAVGSSATLGTNSDFLGTILAAASITATTGATIEGRLLALGGAVTLDTNTITRPVCAAAPSPSPSPTPSTSPSPSPSASSQVARVPVGSVSTGNGTSAGQSAAPYAVFGALVVAGLGGAAAVAVRRRRLNG